MFTDIQNDWAKPCIVQLEKRQLISGYPDGTFRPNASLTRAEFAALTNRLFPNTEQVETPVSFVDVPPSHWAYQDIETATRKRFFSGYPDRTFQPNRTLSRLQAISVLASSRPNLPSANAQTLTRYYDDAAEIPNWAKNAVDRATVAQLVVNYPQIRRLRPQQNVTRGEVAALSCRVLNIDAVSPQQIVSFPPTPTQPRQLLNQTPETIQSYLGIPLKESSSSYGPGKVGLDYVSMGVLQVSGFKEGGTLSVIYENNRSTAIKIDADSTPERNFSYDIPNVFRYLFGYAPKKVEEVPGWKRDGHEGFSGEKRCLGDGLVTYYIIYTLGDNFVDISADPTCR